MSEISKAALVVDGEASESDTEVEASTAASSNTSNVFVISGEAPESDEEASPKIIPQMQDNVQPQQDEEEEEEVVLQERYHSLLHTKLWESNVRLYATVDGLTKSTCRIASEKLAAADKLLLSAQESLGRSNCEMAAARATLKQVKLALEKANCSSALSAVKTR